MNASGILDWLHFSLTEGGPPRKRSILRFASSEDYRRMVQMLERIRPRRQNPGTGNVRRLGLIRGISCPSPPPSIARAISGVIRLEEDEAIRIDALSRGSVSLDQGIPWGVRHIQAPEVWNRTTGYGVRIGVIDTGIDYQHPDLRTSVDRGINLIYRTALPQDDNGHGTHIAGTIAAANRMDGMIGIAPRASIHPVKAFDYGGTAYVSDIILGLDWCIRNRMHIVNMSFGMQNRSRSLMQAVAAANQAGVVVVASSGNDGRSSGIDYPARYGNTIAVGATTESGRVAPFTNRSGLIDIYAPGDKIVSAWIGGKYREMSGTSMATSHVSGAIALLLAFRPGLTPAQVKEIVQQSGKPLKGAKAPRAAGELNVIRLLKAADRRR
jgi:subtilisin family serine protease